MNDLTYLLNKESDTPLYEQLYRAISRDIIEGRLPGGSRLPGRREMSRHLKVSEQTINNALELLKSEGFLRSEGRKGFFVEGIRPLSPGPALSNKQPLAFEPKPRFDFSPQSTDIRLFPYKVFARLIRESILDDPDTMSRGNPKGEAGLRQALKSFLNQYRGVRCEEENLIISSGVDLLMMNIGALFEPGKTIAVEDPGYTEVKRVFERSGHKAVPLPLDESGISMKALERSKAQLVYLTPAHQFPTGISMPVGRRAELLHWAAQKEDRYLIEDDYDSEYRYATRPLPALQGLDAKGKVIYLSTFSRTLVPGLRIAYMALPDKLLNRYGNQRLRAGETVSRFEQQAMARLLEEEHYTRHLRKAGGIYEKRCKALCGLLERIPGAFLQGQEAGLHFLFGIRGKTERELIEPAQKAGIPLTSLSQFTMKARVRPALVLGFGGLMDGELAEAVSALRSCWQV